MERVPWLRVVAALALAIAVISWSGTLIKLAQAPALAVAAWRLGLAAALLLLWSLGRGRFAPAALRGQWRWVLLSGTALALHFASWILSLSYTSVASSVVLVTTSPLFVGLGSYLFLKERPTPALGVGIALSVLGAVVIGWGDFQLGGQALLGDALALVGAWGASAYFLVGRRLRAKLSLSEYVLPVYGVCAVLLLGLALAVGTPLTGFAAPTYMIFLLLALGPQMVGHSTLNWALRYLSAGAVAVVTLGEPVGAALVAHWVLGEPLRGATLGGGAMILAGVALALRGEVGNVNKK